MTTNVAGSDLVAGRNDLSLEDRFSLLADPHRRSVINRLNRASSDVTVETLADHVARDVTGPTEPVDDRRRRVLFALHHNHLPRLADYGVIEYDPDAGTAALA